MRVAFLEDAEQSRVAELVVEVLKDKDATVTEHTHSHVAFEGLNPGTEYAFAKGGYVGVFQHAGETEVELRVRVEAAAPRKWFYRIAAVSIVTTILLFALSASGSIWGNLGVMFWAAFIGAFIVFMGTWRSSWALEASLLDDLLAHIRADARAAGGFERMEDRELARSEEKLEAELLELRLRAARKKGVPVAASAAAPPDAGPHARDAGEEDAAVAAKRERLEALRAERERRQRERDE